MITNNQGYMVTFRKGSIDDPYIDITESLVVINNFVILQELPDKFTKVSISSMSEVSTMAAINTENKFYVDYATGRVFFHPNKNGQHIDNITYKGRGVLSTYSSRILVESDNPDLNGNLQTILDNVEQGISALSSVTAAKDAAIIATTNANTATTNANNATTAANNAASAATTAKTNADAATIAANAAANSANTAASNANAATTAANTATTNANNAASAATTAKTNADTATSNANAATTLANTATTNANTAANNLKFIGDYNSATIYNNRNIVKYNGSLFFCISATPISNITPVDGVNWKLIGTGLNWKGVWSNSVAYNALDLVTYNSSTYICKVSTTAGITPSDNTKWDLVAQAAAVINTTLSQDPVGDMDAATKKYVDSTSSSKDADILRAATPSGVLEFVSGYTSGGPTAQRAQLLAQNAGGIGSAWINIMGVGPFKTNISGSIMEIAKSGDSAGNFFYSGLNANKITLNAPPTSGLREDLVFLEAWFDPADGVGMKNMRWRIRVVDGVDFSKYPEGINYSYSTEYNQQVIAQGANLTVPVVTILSNNAAFYGFYSMSERTASSVTGKKLLLDDVGVYVAGEGGSVSKSNLNTVDGYSYAIPLFRVRRRNTSPYDPVNNPHGGKVFKQYPLTGSAVNISYGQTGQIAVDSTSDLQVGQVLRRTGNAGAIAVVVSIDSPTLVTIRSMYAADVLVVDNNPNNILATSCDRPDQRYSNVVYAEDIIDLRHQVSLTGFPYQNLLMNGLDKLLKAQLWTNAKPRHRRDFIGLPMLADDANTVLLCRFNNSMDGTANGSPVTATKINADPVYKNGVSGQAASFDGTTAREHRYALTGLTTAQGSIEWAMTKDVNSTSSVCPFVITNAADGVSRVLQVAIGSTGIVGINAYNDAGTQSLNLAWTPGASDVLLSAWKTYRFDWDANGVYLYADNVLVASSTTTLSSIISTRGLNYIMIGCGSDGGSIAYRWNGRIDSIRVSNIRRPTNQFQVPSGFNWSNGDRIIDGPDGIRSFWSDDAVVACGLSDVPQQFGNNGYAECQYPVGTPIRHYYQGGLTPGWTSVGLGTVAPTGAMESTVYTSGEYIRVKPNEVVDGVRSTFTFTKPVWAAIGYFLLNSASMGNLVDVNGSSASYITPTSVTIDQNGTLTAIYPSAPIVGSNPTLVYVTGTKHLHLVPNTKGFVIHDWVKYTFTSLVALTNPTTAITLAPGSGGSLAAAIYYVNYVAMDANGAMTALSTVASQAVSVNGKLTITAPTAGNLPTGTDKIRAFINSGSTINTNTAYVSIELTPGASQDVLTLTGLISATTPTANATGGTTYRIMNNRRTVNVVNHVRVTNAGVTTIQNTSGIYSVGADAYGDANHKVTFTSPVTTGATVEVFVEEVVVPEISEAGFWVKYSHVPYQGVAVGGETIQILSDPGQLLVTSSGTGYNASSPYNIVSGLTTNLPLANPVSDSSLKCDTLEFAGFTLGWNGQGGVRFTPVLNTYQGQPRSSTFTMSTAKQKRGTSILAYATEGIPLASSVPHLGVAYVLAKVGSELMMVIQTCYLSNTQVASAGGTYFAADLFHVDGRPLIK